MLRNLNTTRGGLRPMYRPHTGVLGSLIPSTVGGAGQSVVYPQLQLPADADDEFSYWVEDVGTMPAGFWPLDDDGTGVRGPYADGSYSSTVALYRWDVRLFDFPVALTVGLSSASGAGAALEVSAAGSGSARGVAYAAQPDTAASWSYLQTGTLWALTGRDDWTNAPTYDAPVWFLCDYAEESRRMTDATGEEFVARLLVYTSLTGIKQGDRVLMGASVGADPVAAGASEVRAVTRWADTFNAGGAEDFRIAT